MKEKLVKILQKKIYLVLILAAPLLVFNVVHAADVSGAILKSEVTIQSTSGGTQSDRSTSFPMSATALTSLGLLSPDFKNQQLCVEGGACPEVDEVRSSPLGWMVPLDEVMSVDQTANYNNWGQYFQRCQMESNGSYTNQTCGGANPVQLFYNSGGNVQMGDEFWVINQKTVINALEVTISTPWSQGGGGTLDCQWYHVMGGASGTYALTNVVDPSECFTVAGTHTITWDLPTHYQAGYRSWGNYDMTGFWFGFEVTSPGFGTSVRPYGHSFKVGRQDFGAIVPTASAAGTAYDLYVGGPAMKAESEFLGTSGNGGNYAVRMDNPCTWYNCPFHTVWQVYAGGYSVEFEMYFDITKLGGYAVEVMDVGMVACYSNYAHFGCVDPMGTKSGWGQSYNCPNGAAYGSGFGNFQAILQEEGWHKIKWERAVGNSSLVDDYCKLYIDDVLISTQAPTYTYPYYQWSANNNEHEWGGNANIEGIRRVMYNDCYFDTSTGYPSGNNNCHYYPGSPNKWSYDIDFTDGWEGPTWEKDKTDNGYNGQIYYMNLQNMQNPKQDYFGNAYSAYLTNANVGPFTAVSGGGGPGAASTTLPAVDVITDMDPSGTFAGTTTVGTNLPGGAFLAEMAAQQNVPVSFFWAIIAAGITIAVLALVMKYLKNILIAALMGGIVLAGFTVPAVGIFPIWVLFFYTIIAGAVVIIGNRWGISV